MRTASKYSIHGQLTTFKSRRRRLWLELLETRRVLAGNGPPNVLSINRLDANPTNASQVAFQVVFDEAVVASTVNANDFVLVDGNALTSESIASVSGTGATYTVQVNTGTGSGSLRLDLIDNDSIRDVNNNLRLGGNGQGNGNFTGQSYTIDRIVPTATSLNRSSTNPSIAATVNYALTFSESVTGVDSSDFDLIASGVTGAAVSSISGSGSSYTITVSTGTGEGTLQLRLLDDDTIRDSATNRLGGTGVNNGTLVGQSYTIARAPSVVSVTPLDITYTNANTARFGVEFSKPVFNVDVNDFVTSTLGSLTGTTIASVTGSGTSYIVTATTGTGEGSLFINKSPTVSIVDSLGFALTDSWPGGQGYILDRTAPTVVSVALLDPSPINASSVRFSVTFSEPVTSLAIDDFSLITSGLSGVFISSVVQASNNVWTVTTATGSGTGSLSLRVLSDNQILDLGGNALGASVTGSSSYSIDRTGPILQNVARNNPALTNADTVSYALTFSEPVTGLTQSAFTIDTPGLIGASIQSLTGSGANYTVTLFTGSGQSTLGMSYSMTVADLAGNTTNVLGSAPLYTVDKTIPVVQQILPLARIPANNPLITFSVVFSEYVYGVTLDDFRLRTTGTISATIVSATTLASYQWDVAVSVGTGDGTIFLDLVDDDSITDLINPLAGPGAGNGSYTSTTGFVIETIPTVLSITPQGLNPTSSSTASFAVQFSEPVTGVDASDFAMVSTGITGATISSVTGSGANYTLNVTGITGSGTLAVALNDNDSIVDGIGLPLNGTGSANAVLTSSPLLLIDQAPPIVTSFTAVNPSVTRASFVDFRLTFSENVFGVDASDFAFETTGSLSGLSVSNIARANNVYTVTVAVGSGNGTVRLKLVDNDSITDTANLPLGGTGLGNGDLTSSSGYTLENTGASSISGVLYQDLNKNGIRDNGEPPQSNWTVYLDNNRNRLLDFGDVTTTTAADGSYVFNGLFSGQYTVTEVIQAGWEQTSPGPNSYPIKGITVSQPGTGSTSSDAPSVSADGRYIAFSSSAALVPGDTNIGDIFLYDRVLGSTSKITNGLGGTVANSGSFLPAISNDGRLVAFYSFATNLVAGDTNGQPDVFVYDTQTQTTTLISRAPDGSLANGASNSSVDISGDGRYVTFHSTATNLIANDTNNRNDVFVVDLQDSNPATRLQLVSKSNAGVIGNGNSYNARLSDDGNLIVYESEADNLVGSDTNLVNDIFLFNRSTSTTRRISVTSSGAQLPQAAQEPSISGDGNFAAFWTIANGVVPSDTNSTPDIFIVNLNTGAAELISQLPSGQSGVAFGPTRLSTTGRYVAFTSNNSLLANGTDSEVFLRDRLDTVNPIRRVTRTPSGAAPNGGNSSPALSDDGRFVAFTSDAKHLVSNDTNNERDVFFVDVSYPWSPNGYSVTLNVGQAVNNIDMGNRLLQGEVYGVSWQDTSRNGVRDAGEPVNVGRQIYADANLNGVWDAGELITTTDASGNYRLTPLGTGTSQIREILPTDWTTTAGVIQRTIGARSLSLNFEELGPVTVSSTLGVYQRDQFVLAATYPGTGQWRIDVPSGSNTVELVALSTLGNQYLMRKDYRPFSVTSLSLRSATAGTVTFTGDKTDGTLATQTFITGAKNTFSFGAFTNLLSMRWATNVPLYIDNIEIQTTDFDYAGTDLGSMTLPAEVRGTVYFDTNQNGTWDGNEPPLANRQVYLDANNNGLFDANEASTISTTAGSYAFTVLNAGSYIVRQRLPLNWSQTEPASGYAVELSPNQVLNNLNFGSFGSPGAIQGTKWNDLNADGVRDASEPGLAGWTIYLDLNNNSTLDVGEPSTVTRTDDPLTIAVDETGSYEFNNLLPVGYTVREVPQVGWQQTSPVATKSSIQLSASTGITNPTFAHHPEYDHFVSGTGRYEVFTSINSLLPQDTNTVMDVYLLDRQTGGLSLVSGGLSGAASNSLNLEPTVSDDGRYVAFRSFATNLTSNPVNPNTVNIYVRDVVAGTTQLITGDTNSPANNFSYQPVISGDGRWLVFFSWASNLVAGDTDQLPDFFIKDLVGGQLTRVEASQVVPSMTIAETWGGDISTDGRYVAFQAVSQGISHIFWMDRINNQIRLVSTNSAGTRGNGQSEKLSISDDGRFVAFDSSSTNLTDEPNVNSFNVYLKDMVTGEIRMLSRNVDGVAAGASRRPEISRDGRWVVFESTSQTMFTDSANSPSQIVLYDRLTNSLTRLTGAGGVKGNASSVNASISSDGRVIAFQSIATNLGATGPGLFTIERTLDYSAPQPITVNLAAGTTISRADFGNAQTNNSISGFAFEDTNRNGVRDEVETAIAGATVYLDLNKNGVREAGEPNLLTAGDGSYSFNSLLPGTYTVRADVPANRVATGPATTRARLYGVTGAATNTIVELNPQTGTPVGVINPLLQASGPLGAAFDGTNVLILSSTYGLVRVAPSGAVTRLQLNFDFQSGLAFQNGLAYFLARINAWPHLVALNSSNGQVVRTLPITFSDGGFNTSQFPFGRALGEAPDGNGLIASAASGPALNPRVFRIDTSTGRVTQYLNLLDVSAEGATSVGGELFISSSNAIRVYNAQFQLLRTMSTIQTYAGLAGGTTLDYSQSITVQSGQSVSSVNFGQRTTLSSITGQLYDDRNNNQQADSGEPGLPGITVYIDSNLNNQFDIGEPTTQTDSSGRYTLANVGTGERTVQAVAPNGMQVSSTVTADTRLFGMRVAATTGGLVELNPITGAVKANLTAPIATSISTSAGLAFDGTDLFFLESNTRLLYALNPSNGGVRRSLQLPGAGYDGLAVVGGKLYAQNHVDNTIVEIDTALTGIQRTLDINALNPNYLGAGTIIDLAGALGESAGGTRLIAQANNSTSYIINPVTGLIEGTWAVGSYIGLAGAAGEVFTTTSGGVLLDVFNSQAQLIRRGNITTASMVSLAAAATITRGVRVTVVSAQDAQANIALRDITIPTAINFSATTVAENLTAGSVVANLASVDANLNDVHQYALVPGIGDTDNGLFEIAGSQLRAKQAFDYESRNNFSIRLRTTDASGNSLEAVQSISVINLPEVITAQIGDGSAQRSTLDRIVLELEGQLDIDAGAFIVQKRERNAQGALLLQTVDTTPVIDLLPSGNTRVTLTFSGAYVRVPVVSPRLGALADGNYQLTLDASKIRTAGTQTQLDGDRDGISGGNYVLGAQAADKFFAHYGDTDGDRTVGVADFGRFRSAFGKNKGDAGYDAALDYDSNDSIGVTDFGQFRARFGKSMDF